MQGAERTRKFKRTVRSSNLKLACWHRHPDGDRRLPVSLWGRVKPGSPGLGGGGRTATVTAAGVAGAVRARARSRHTEARDESRLSPPVTA